MKKLVNKILLTEYDGKEFMINLKEPEWIELKDEDKILRGFQKELPELVLTKIKFIYN